MRYCTKKLYKRTFLPNEVYELFGNYVGKNIRNLQILGYNQEKSLLKNKFIFSCKCLICGKYCDREIYKILYGLFSDCGDCSHKEWSKTKIIDICGNRYGKLLVLEKSENTNRANRKSYWKCLCDCGNNVIVSKNYLKTSKLPSCGCVRYEKIRKTSSKDISNHKFGLLTALCLTEDKRKTSKNRANYWKCLCECGKETVVSTSSLMSGSTRSCGCKANYSSFWENEVIDVILKRYNIDYKKQFRLYYIDSGRKRYFSYDCAFFVNGKTIILECNGTRYHPKSPTQLDKDGNCWKNPYGETAQQRYRHDMIKNNFAKCMGYDIITVWDDDSMKTISNKLFEYFDKIIGD